MRYLSKLVKRLSMNDVGRRALIWVVLLSISACTDAGDPTSADVVALRLLPQEPQVAMGDSLEFAAFGVTATGDTVELEVTWSTAQGEIKGKGKGKGLYKPRGSGKDKVTAGADSLADSTTVTVVPAAPVISSPTNGATLTTATPTIAGTTQGSTAVEVFVDAGRVGTVSANGAGSWAYTLTGAQALADGAHATSAVAIDGDGNRSPASATVNFATTVLDTVGVIAGLAPADYEVARLRVGDQYYIDRSYTITELSPGLVDRLWIRTANADKGGTAGKRLSWSATTAVQLASLAGSRAGRRRRPA
jgi:VCBS repeat-containing protein